MTERWDRVTAVFAAARALTPPLRSQFLDMACAGDAEFRTAVDTLLASDKDDSFLTRSPWATPPAPALAPGTQFGPYVIESAIGSGGMGAVYRARDTTLDRQVALKLLPSAFVDDPDRRARFEREARLLASLNHPNIAHIYGFDQSEAGPFLVLELVDGELLSELIARGPVPRETALSIAGQIVDALETAHAQGIVHRDLKPANIKVRPDGTVKVLDFGLAKALDPASGVGFDLNRTSRPDPCVTATDLLVGTAAYMAPERTKGAPADGRADIWAFGVVVFELLTGQQLFAGESASEVLASVIRDEPDWTRLPADTSEAMRRLLRRCLEKDPRKRLSSIADARLEIGESLDAPIARAHLRLPRRPLAILSGALGVSAAIAAVWFLMASPSRPLSDQQPARVSVLGPAGITLLLDPSESAISPDGRSLVFSSVDPQGETLLWLRPLDALVAQPIAGTERAVLPFWSPDSREIAFFAKEKLKKVPVTGGTAVELCVAKGARGGTWGSDGTIIFAPANAGPLHSVAASGGESRAITTLDANRHETGHRFPWFLPDGRHFLYAALPPHEQAFNIFVGSLDGSTPEFVTSADGAAVYTAPGYLVFPRRNTLLAQRFDPRRRKLLDEPVAIGEAPSALGALYSASRAVSASAAGALAYLDDSLPNTRLEWFDRSGRALGPLGVPDGRYKEFAFAPDGHHASVVRYASASESDIWNIDLDRGGATRFTYGPAGNVSAAWSPDSTQVVFDSDRDGTRNLFVKAADGASQEEPVYTSPVLFKYARSWTPDGQSIVFDQLDPVTNRDLWVLPVNGARAPSIYLRTPFTEGWGQVSPDGRWLTYVSDETGLMEIYVDSFPTPRHKVRVTNGGGGAPMWRNDGKELAFLSLDSRAMLVADVTAGTDFHATPPRLLMPLPAGTVYALPTPDFQRVLVATPMTERPRSSLTLMFGWAAALKTH